jgi:RAQPRD family integrative conjugative element protein
MKTNIQLWALSIAIGAISPAYATTNLENADLSLVVQQLQAVYPLIAEAQQQADPNARTQFHYDWLRGDLNTVITGINQKLKPLPLEPREIKPLKGDYLTVGSNAL